MWYLRMLVAELYDATVYEDNGGLANERFLRCTIAAYSIG